MGNRQSRARGFSFAEVMFAVIILGIGFIMVAAMFPVAIQQTRLTVDESAAAAVARQAASVLEQVAVGSETGTASRQPLFPATVTGGAQPSILAVRMAGFGPATVPPPELWERVKGNLISPANPQYAWTALYSRATNSQFIQVYIFVVQQRNRAVFDKNDLYKSSPALPVNLQPRRIRVQIEPASGTNPNQLVDRIIITQNQRFAVEGAFVITGDGTTNKAGRVYRLGQFLGDQGGGDAYDVDPGYDVPDSPLGDYTGDAWIVGRGFHPPEANPPVPTGPAMDVAVYTTFLNVN